jgi:hypothetical protein
MPLPSVSFELILMQACEIEPPATATGAPAAQRLIHDAQPVSYQRPRQRGRQRLADHDKREHCFSVRVNAEEQAIINRLRGRMRAGEYLRLAGLKSLPSAVPELNRQAWVKLAPLAANMNQIAALLHRGLPVDTEAVQHDIQRLISAIEGLRLGLLGASTGLSSVSPASSSAQSSSLSSQRSSSAS